MLSAIAAAVMVLACLSLLAALPAVVERVLIPRVADSLRITPFACKVRSIGFSGIDLAQVRLGAPDFPDISIDTIHIGYTLAGLLSRRIDEVVISGTVVRVEYEEGNIYFTGFDPGPLLYRAGSGNDAAPGGGFSKQFPLDRLELRNSVLVCRRKDDMFRLPLDIEIGFAPAGPQCRVRIHPFGQTFTAKASLDKGIDGVSFSFQGDDVDLAAFSALFRRIPALDLRGFVDVSASASLSLNPFRIDSAEAVISIEQGSLSAGPFSAVTPPEAGETAGVTEIYLARENGDISISTGAFEMTGPWPFKVSAIRGTVDRITDGAGAAGKLHISIKEHAVGTKGERMRIFPFDAGLAWDVRKTAGGSWVAAVTNAVSGKKAPVPIRADLAGGVLKSILPSFNLTAEKGRDGITSQLKVRFPAIRFDSPGASIRMKGAEIAGNISMGPESKTPSGKLVLNARKTVIKKGPATLTLPRIHLEGRLAPAAGGKNQMAGTASVTGASLALPSREFRARDINLRLPLAWPLPKKVKKGRFSSAALQWQEIDLISIDGDVVQAGAGLDFDFLLAGKAIPDLRLNLSGNAALSGGAGVTGEIRYHLAPYRVPETLDLAQWIPALEGSNLSGTVMLDGTAYFDEKGPRSSVKFGLTEGNIALAAEDFRMEGVELSLSFSDLAQLRSDPDQHFGFSRVTKGNLMAENGSFRFQVESPSSLFLEKGRLSWCGGTLQPQAFRLLREKTAYDLTLFCDRLKVSEVLKQLADLHADGKGAVSGTIPIGIDNGKIAFTDGFLYSSPGEGGVIRLMGTEMLTAGIPANTPQFAQLELAREALKHYRYDWVKMTLNSHGDELQLKMQLDGKPTKPLPFVYRKDLGSFVKVDASSPGSRFQGIAIDVNFKLPLNTILDYGTGMKDLLKLSQ